MTVCGEKVTGVCVAAKCPHFKRCCPVVWDKYGKIKPRTNDEWRRTCSAEEFANWIREDVCADSFWQRAYDWESWLKEKHE